MLNSMWLTPKWSQDHKLCCSLNLSHSYKSCGKCPELNFQSLVSSVGSRVWSKTHSLVHLSQLLYILTAIYRQLLLLVLIIAITYLLARHRAQEQTANGTNCSSFSQLILTGPEGEVNNKQVKCKGKGLSLVGHQQMPNCANR